MAHLSEDKMEVNPQFFIDIHSKDNKRRDICILFYGVKRY